MSKFFKLVGLALIIVGTLLCVTPVISSAFMIDESIWPILELFIVICIFSMIVSLSIYAFLFQILSNRWYSCLPGILISLFFTTIYIVNIITLSGYILLLIHKLVTQEPRHSDNTINPLLNNQFINNT